MTMIGQSDCRKEGIWIIIYSLVSLWEGKYPSYTSPDIIQKYILRWDITIALGHAR